MPVTARRPAPTVHKGNVQDYFASNVRYWQDAYESGSSGISAADASLMQNRKQAVLATVDAYSRGRRLRVLDVGCGPGVILEELARRGHTVSGLDISPAMVREANERLQRCGAGTPCRQGDVERLGFPGNSMDIVLCLGVLPYLHEDHVGMSELARVLRTGGLGILVLPNLLRLGPLFDPYYYLWRGWQYVRYQFLAARHTTGERTSADDFGENRNFAIRRYGFWHIDPLFHYSRLCKTGVEGIDYGPLTFWSRAFLPDRTSVKMSDCLTWLSRRHGFSWLTCLANQWVISFIKE